MPDQPLQHLLKVKRLLPRSSKLVPLAWIALFALGFLDIVFKQLARTYLSSTEPLFQNGLIDLLFFKNTGIAFSLPVPPLISVSVSFVLIGYFSWCFAQNTRSHEGIAALSIVIGSLSNLYDRLAHGFVVDYLLLFGRSAINIADLLILLGIFFFIRYNKSII